MAVGSAIIAGALLVGTTAAVSAYSAKEGRKDAKDEREFLAQQAKEEREHLAAQQQQHLGVQEANRQRTVNAANAATDAFESAIALDKKREEASLAKGQFQGSAFASDDAFDQYLQNFVFPDQEEEKQESLLKKQI